jgi:hypothetical protein
MFKKAAAICLAFVMIMGSSTAVLAKDNGNKKEKDDNKLELHLTFDDLKNAEWAVRYIASLASRRVFEGYEDGTFKPDNTVSRIEAITAAVRLMGLRSQAESAAEMSTHLNFKDADKVPSWAVGYVAVALENDLFSENDDSVQPQKAADRLWATTLLVKALKLEAGAKAKMNTTLPFKDAKQIPAGSVGYIAVAFEKGLIDGFEDNTFRPHQLVTRAQLAALLDRTGGQLPDQGENTINGTISAPVSNNMLKITRLGTTTEYTLHPDVFIFRNGAKVNAAALQAGDEVKVRTYNSQIVFIEVTKPVQAIIYSGTISSIVNNNTLTLTKSGVASTFTLHSDVFIYRNGVKVAATDLKVGDEVNIRFSDNKVIYIEVTNPVQVIIYSGIISSNVNNTLTLTKSGVTSTFTLHSDVVVYRNGVKAAAADLKVGDEVNIRFSDNKVIFIEVTNPVQVIINSGTITSKTNTTLTLTKSGVTSTFTLHSDVIVYRNGVKAAAADLKVGDEVNIRFSDNKVIFIEVTNPMQVIINSGIISAKTNTTLTLTKSGVTSTFTLHSDVIVYRNGVKATVADLKVGDDVNIRFSDNKVIFIEVTIPVQVIINSGTISAKTNTTLTLTKSGVTSTFTLHTDVIVYRNGVKAAAADLKVGDEVSIRFSESKVIYIEVTKMVVPDVTLDIIGALKATTVDAMGELATISIAQTINGNEQTTIYNVSPNVTLSGNLALFVTGHLIQLKGTNMLITAIIIK